ncbi:zinc metallopeptidase [Elongatibacter sediminis]|uniref:Zinc metallopeptidase n=1 Tax=Elongatibacter sediminis TaxID=3119006 RepID=A0AAW9RD93_9GAMM
MHLILPIVIVLIIVLGPGIWVQRVMKRYSEPADRYDLTGAEMARRLLDARELGDVKVEVTEGGDHYDPVEKVVRLSPGHHARRSLAAVTVAAHEVGHAVQDATGFAPLRMRTRLVAWLRPLEKTGAALLMFTPIIVAITRMPLAGGLMLLGGLLTLGSAVLVHLLTLPTEFDASYQRALPMLEQSGLMYESDFAHARKLLRAAAMTYVAASLTSLLNIARWWAILRR